MDREGASEDTELEDNTNQGGDQDDNAGSPDPDEGEDPNTDDAEGDDNADDADGDEGNAEGDDAGGDEPPANNRRAASRVSKVVNERNAEKTRADNAEAELNRLRRQMEDVQRQVHQGDARRTAQEEQELLANMDPLQRVQYEAEKKISGLQQEIRSVQITALDSQDKATFLSKASQDPIRAKYVDKVEKALSEMRAKGINAPRDDIYFYMLGKSFAEQKQKNAGKGPDKNAQNRVNTTRARPTSARGDAGGNRGRGKTAEERLEGVNI